jgi:putative redox protein
MPDELGSVRVRALDGEAYELEVRGHRILVDQPVGAGGRDQAPTPTELFIASLAGCVGYYAGRYLTRHGFSRAELAVSADYDMATDRPARVTAIRVRIRIPDDLPAARVAGLLAMASHCTVHNSIEHRPSMTVEIEPPAPHARAA